MTIKELFAPSDMTVGKPWEKIVIFTIPMLIGNIAQQLYNTVDSIVIGKYVGDNALAAVGSASPILNLLLVLFVGIPLPGTGAWTGSLIAALLGIRFRKAFPAIVIGICLATVIMCVVSYGILGGLFG